MSILVLLVFGYCISSIVTFYIVAYLEKEETHITGGAMIFMIGMLILGPVGTIVMVIIAFVELCQKDTFELKVRNPLHKK